MIALLELLPTWYQYSLVGLLGLIIGSFLNVVIYRYHTGKSLSGHSHCLSCGQTLRWYELFPLVSYVCLFGKCKSCGCSIPVRYFLVEIVTSLMFISLFLQMSLSILFLFSLVLVSVLMVIAVYDMYHMVIPNELVIGTSVLAVLYFVIEYWRSWDVESLAWHVVAALGAFLFYGGLWFVSKGRWIGFGDAKLAIPLGFILGAPGALTFIVFSFWIGAIVSLGMIGIPALFHVLKAYCSAYPVVNYAKYFTMKSEVPFAPFMIAAFLLVYIYHLDVLHLVAIFI
jgi:leader peptidase (prepilin peptidase)/N-methyltransferase